MHAGNLRLHHFWMPLPRVQYVKDLGVTLDSELTFRIHYNDIIAKANRQLGFIFKIADEFRDPLCLRSLYCSLVRSILESNAVIWCPSHANWIMRIEAIQRKFVRYSLRSLNLPPYADRCRFLSIEPLATRRIVAQATFTGKLLHLRHLSRTWDTVTTTKLPISRATES